MFNSDNTGKHILFIINTTSCGKHNAQVKEACWRVPISNESGVTEPLSGVCGRRIKRAGFDGKISSTSMRTKSSTTKKPSSKKSR